MRHPRLVLAMALASTLLLSVAPAGAQMAPAAPKSETALAIEKALASEIRTAEERARDTRERKPVQTLEFFGLQPDMTVLELLPGAGWYTKILGQVLADQGKLYVAIGADRLAPRFKEWKLDKIEAPAITAQLLSSNQPGVFQADAIELPMRDVDMVLTFRNYHNMTPETRARLNGAVLATLKPGGIYGIVDHTRRHMEPGGSENWRRVDPVLVIKEVEAAGFEFVDFSNLHYRPDDELRYDSGRASLGNYSDRFTLKFRKPAAAK